MRESLRRFVAKNGSGGIKWVRAATVLLLSACSAASCNFPNYGFETDALGAAGDAAAGGGAAGGGAGGASGNAVGGAAGALVAGAAGRAEGGAGNSGVAGGDEAAAGSAGDAGDAGADDCVVDVPIPPDATCSNGTLDGEETGIDCGGTICHPCFHNEACLRNEDCVSGSCASSMCTALVQLETQAIVRTDLSSNLQFRFRVRANTTPLVLKSLSVRYYFALSNVAEPVLPLSTQAVLDNMDIAKDTHWQIVHVLQPDPSKTTTAYLEVTFSSTFSISPGKALELTQSIQAGSAPNRLFQQSTHYSYADNDSYKVNEHAAVYYNGKLSWGTPPTYDVALGCFQTAINFGGGALDISERPFLAGDDSSVTAAGTPLQVNTTPFPTPDPQYLPLLQSATVLDTEQASIALPNGEYWVYPYVVSAGGTNQANLLVEGKVADLFAAGMLDNAPTWAELGPYSVSVRDNSLDFSASGGPIRLAGVEVFRKAQ